jgi:hypothetical protein
MRLSNETEMTVIYRYALTSVSFLILYSLSLLQKNLLLKLQDVLHYECVSL